MDSTKRTSTRSIPRAYRVGDLPAIADAYGVIEHGDKLRMPCPVHNGADHNVSVWTRDDGTLGAKCHSEECPEDVLWEAIREHVGEGARNGHHRPVERSEPAELPTDDEWSQWRDTLRRGPDDGTRMAEQLRATGWAGHEAALADLGIGHNTHRFVVPIHDAAGQLVNLVRYAPGSVAKSRTLLGRPRDLFPPPELIDGSRIFLFEGEPDTVTGQLAGLPAVAVPGKGGWKSSWVERFRGRSVIVCFDCADDAREEADKIVAELGSAGIHAARIDLAPDRRDGFDFKDLAREDGLDQAAEHVWNLSEINTADLLAEVADFLSSYVVFADEWQPVALALWTLHTYALDAAEQSPYLVITAPEKRCGKTMLRDALSEIVRQPWTIDAAPTESTIFRKISADQPTLLLDEVDALFRGSRERVEPLRALFNGGNRRGATVPRCVGEGSKYEVIDFEIFCAKALVGIDAARWPSTIRDRSIEVVLRRKRRDESVKRFRRREVAPIAAAIRQEAELWATPERIAGLTEARPDLPDDLDDRAADGWEPLLAIADMAGGDWPERAREAATVLSGGRTDFTADSPAVRLLADIAGIFDTRGDRVSSADLLADLHALDEAPWGDPPQLTPRRLAEMLRPFGVRRGTVRIGEDTAKGYKREDFADPLTRYVGGVHGLKRKAPGAVTPVTSVTSQPQSHAVVTHVTGVTPPGHNGSPRPRPRPGGPPPTPTTEDR
jgi:uncharacterized protein DUF3631